MFREDVERLHFALWIPSSHPQEDAAPVQLFLQIVGVMLADDSCQARADEPSCTASQRRSNDCPRKGAAGGHDRAGHNNSSDVHQPTDQSPLGIFAAELEIPEDDARCLFGALDSAALLAGEIESASMIDAIERCDIDPSVFG